MRLILLVLTMLMVSSAKADPEKQAKELVLAPYFNAVLVKDIRQSIDWYQKVLGFELVNQVDMMASRGFSQANLKRAGSWLELIETDKTIHPKAILKGKPKKSKIGGYFKMGFEVAQLDNWVAWLKQSKVQLYGDVVKDPNTGKRTLLFLDPDGNRIQLFER